METANDTMAQWLNGTAAQRRKGSEANERLSESGSLGTEETKEKRLSVNLRNLRENSPFRGPGAYLGVWRTANDGRFGVYGVWL